MQKKLMSISIKHFNQFMRGRGCLTIEGEEDVWHMKRTIDTSILHDKERDEINQLYADIAGWWMNLKDEL